MPAIKASQFQAWLSEELRKDTEILRKAAVDTCLWGERRAVKVTDEYGAVDQGMFRLSWTTSQTISDRVVELRNDTPYAGIIEHGRRPGRPGPPLAPIYAWVQRKFRPDAVQQYRYAKRMAMAMAGYKASQYAGPLSKKGARARRTALRHQVRAAFGTEERAVNARLWAIAFEIREAIHVRGIKPRFILRRVFAEMKIRLPPEAIRRLRRAHRNRG